MYAVEMPLPTCESQAMPYKDLRTVTVYSPYMGNGIATEVSQDSIEKELGVPWILHFVHLNRVRTGEKASSASRIVPNHKSLHHATYFRTLGPYMGLSLPNHYKSQTPAYNTNK